MLKVIKKSSNIKSNRLVKMKIKNSIIQQDLIIFQKLSKIFIYIILINTNMED